jgi:uncharacterized protein YcfJ
MCKSLAVGHSRMRDTGSCPKEPSHWSDSKVGGDATGSMMGGVIGYSIQKDNDERCV